MLRIAKLELYIILAALIIASFIIGLFWALNRGETPNAVFKQPSQSTAADKADTATPLEPASEKPAPEPIVEEIKVTQQGLAQLTELTTVKTLVLGDAVAASQGASNKDELGWHALVSKALQGKYPGSFQWIFKTTDKATVNDVLTFVPEVTPDTDLIILCLGRNDWAVLTTKDFKQKYVELLRGLKTQKSSADIFLVVDPPVKNIENNNKFFPYRQAILELGKNHQLPVIDQWSAFIQDPAPLAELLADGVNPNDKGYRVFADEVVKGFEGVLADKY